MYFGSFVVCILGAFGVFVVLLVYFGAFVALWYLLSFSGLVPFGNISPEDWSALNRSYENVSCWPFQYFIKYCKQWNIKIPTLPMEIYIFIFSKSECSSTNLPKQTPGLLPCFLEVIIVCFCLLLPNHVIFSSIHKYCCLNEDN